MINVREAKVRRTRWAIALAYVSCWIAGLLIGGPDLDAKASSEAVHLAFDGSSATLAFAILVHGAAGALLGALGWSLSYGRGKRLIVTLAVVAAALSFMQLAGETVLVLAPGGVDAATLWESITRIDGVKMIVLAGLIAAVHGGALRGGAVSAVVAGVTALALVISGAGYLFVVPELMVAATASLPLLLLWSLVATARRSRQERPARSR